ncbi:hypothetical protein M2322_003035 [Rhodoblastus acidophilus]|uniref:hypothetical protein n=1 Tax=Rhodoblastus acidophilus TaxID=1074 RepID=UPI0022252D2A|nr:hypothetical protein [Rhodoblastus acidophilus]MCW2317476.1 hypothetical protein [Rhodoblastus acidophilus]
MVAKPGTYQASFNAGELAPELWGNTGLKQFFSGLSAARNIASVPQGGFDLLPRSRHLGVIGNAANARLFRFTVSRSLAYVVILMAGQVAIWRNGALQATLWAPYADADVPFVKVVQRAETMMLFHQAYETKRLIRHGSDTAWSLDATPWVHIPDVDYGGAYAKTDEVWKIYLYWPSSGFTLAGMGFVVSVDGIETATIPVTTMQTQTFGSTVTTVDPVATASTVQAALIDLANVEPGITVSGVLSTATSITFQVTFSGGLNSGNSFTVSGRVVTTGSAALQTSRAVQGKPGGESLFSASRGYAACAAFYQDRLIQGGFASKGSAWLASRTSEYFDQNVDLTGASGAMLINIDADGSEEIEHIIQARHLCIFTSDAEYFVADRALQKTQPPNIVRSSTYGASKRVPPVFEESSLLFVSREESIVYAATYNEVASAYEASPQSLLSSHLIFGIRDAALQVSTSATDSQRYFLPRDDGVMVVALLIRNQDVYPFVRWETDGKVRAIVVDGANVPHMLVERQIGGVAKLCFERLEDGLLLDGAVTQSFGAPTTAIGGLWMHEGATCWAIVDGYVEGPFTVSGGSITLANAGSVVTVGRWTAPIAATLPLPRDVGQRTVLKRPCRVHTVQLDLIGTTSLAVGANGQPPRDVPLARVTDPTDAPTPPYTGEKIITGIAGFSADGIAVITQLRPGKLQVRNVTLQAKV